MIATFPDHFDLFLFVQRRIYDRLNIEPDT
jgi:hypothetical protein